MLTTVTITGADDRTDPAALVALSKEFPFVEWGLLLSASRMGTSRYPSRAWLMEFEQVARETIAMRYAVHFCGQCTRDTLEGSTKWVDDIHPARIQLNGFEPTAPFVELAKRLGQKPRALSFILQARDVSGVLHYASVVEQIGGDTSVLYDPSGGTGKTTRDWPTVQGIPLGFAGGIGPDNVEEVINALHAQRHDGAFWIDMESRVRSSDDRLDLARVRAVLEVAKRCMQAAS